MQLASKSLDNAVVKTGNVGVRGVDRVFTAIVGYVLLRADDRVILYDVNAVRIWGCGCVGCGCARWGVLRGS